MTQCGRVGKGSASESRCESDRGTSTGWIEPVAIGGHFKVSRATQRPTTGMARREGNRVSTAGGGDDLRNQQRHKTAYSKEVSPTQSLSDARSRWQSVPTLKPEWSKNIPAH